MKRLDKGSDESAEPVRGTLMKDVSFEPLLGYVVLAGDSTGTDESGDGRIASEMQCPSMGSCSRIVKSHEQ